MRVRATERTNVNPERKRDRSIEKLKSAALRLIAANGYSNASLEEITREAGFTKGAIYYYFKSKKRLILEIIDDIEQRSIGRTSQALDLEGGSAKDLLVEFSKSQARWALEHPDDLGVMIMMSVGHAQRDADIHDKIEQVYGKMAGLLRRVIQAGVDSHELPADTHVDSIVNSIIAIHDGNMLRWFRAGRDPKAGRELVTSLLDALLHPITFD